jgi:Calx-beta domain
VRRKYLSLWVLLLTLATILATPTAGLADDDDRGRGRGRDRDRHEQNDDDRRGPNNDRQNRGQEDDNRFRRVGICHVTGSERHPLVFIRVAEEAVIAHQLHGDIIGVNSERDCRGQAVQGGVRIGDAVCREGEQCMFAVTQVGGTGSVNVTFATEDRTATGGTACGPIGIDYETQVGTLTIGAGLSQTIAIRTCTDNLSGPNERFRVRLTGVSSGQIIDGVGRGVIVEASAVSGGLTVLATSDALGNVGLSWGEAGVNGHRVYFAIGTGCTFNTTDVRFFSSPAASGTVNVPVPNTQFCFQVRRVEANGTETPIVATATTGGAGTTTGTLTVNNPTCFEGVACSFTITQTGGTTTATGTYTTASTGSATPGASCLPGVDFVQVTAAPFSVGPGSTTTVTLPQAPCADGITGEAAETFMVVLSTGTPGTTSGTITIAAN